MEDLPLQPSKRPRIRTPHDKEKQRQLQRARYLNKIRSSCQERRTMLHTNIHEQDCVWSASCRMQSFNSAENISGLLLRNYNSQIINPEEVEKPDRSTATLQIPSVCIDNLSAVRSNDRIHYMHHNENAWPCVSLQELGTQIGHDESAIAQPLHMLVRLHNGESNPESLHLQSLSRNVDEREAITNSCIIGMDNRRVSSSAVTGNTMATTTADCHGDVSASCSQGVVRRTWKAGSSREAAKQKCNLSIIEFQKRGLPHAHILLTLEATKKLKSSAQIDSIISAEIPDYTNDPVRHDLIMSHMIHGPCGNYKPSAPCMKDGKCTKGYPKPYSDFTWIDEMAFQFIGVEQKTLLELLMV